jgi:hypothetical protein
MFLFFRWTRPSPRMPPEPLRSVGGAVLPLLMVFAQCGMPVRPSSEAASGLLDPKQIQIGEILYDKCSGWGSGRMPRPYTPLDRPIVVDIYFSGPGGNLTPGHEQNVAAHGGRILYRYQLAVIRAEIRPSQIERVATAGGLFFSGNVNHVRSVPDPERMDLEILALYRGPIRDSDLQRITKLGARVKHVLAATDVIVADIPDQAIRALRSDTSVIYVGYSGMVCAHE